MEIKGGFMMEIGMKIYFEKATGNVVVNTGEQVGRLVVETTEDQDFATYKVLAERVRETIGVVKLKYGQFRREFAECNGYRVNPETETLEFTYPGEVPAEVLIKRIEMVEEESAKTAQELEQTNMKLKQTETQLAESLERLGQTETQLQEAQLALTENYEELQTAKQEAADTQLALTELYEKVLAGITDGQPETPAESTDPVEGGEEDNA
jgi:DNA repair exonuclease SbcCD ATPase subunit